MPQFFLYVMIFLWLVATAGLGLSHPVHPTWALLTLPLVLLVWGSLMGKAKEKTLKRRLAICLLLLALMGMTGFCVQMGLFPLFFHQMIVWPGILICSTTLFTLPR